MCSRNLVGNLGLLLRFCGGKRHNLGSSHCTLGLLLCHIFCQINTISTILYFSVAISLLANPKVCGLYCDYANDLLCTFVNNALALYGHEVMVYNVHGLVHLAEDVMKFGCLENFSAFLLKMLSWV